MISKYIFRFTIVILFLSNKSFAQPTYEWAGQFGGIGNEYGYNITTDASGNVYSIGYFVGTVDFDPGVAISNLTSSGSNDIFVSKLDADGNFLWAKKFGGTGSDIGLAICVDAAGNVYTTGNFAGTADFDPGVGVSNLINPLGNSDAFISKLDNNGNFVWAKQFTSSALGTSGGSEIAVDGIGNVFIYGGFMATVDFNPGAGTANLSSFSISSYDVFVAKLDGSGNFIFAKQLGGTSHDNAISMALDSDDNILITGSFLGTADFDPGAASFNLTPIGTLDIFIAKLNSSGNFVWAKSVGGSGSDVGRDISVDGNDNVYVTGNFNTTADFDPGAGVFNMTAVAFQDGFVVKLDENGTFVWSKQIAGSAADYLSTIAIDQSGNSYISGFFQGTTDFDPGAGTSNLTSVASDDAFITKLDIDGNFVWVIPFAGTFDEAGLAITVDNSNNIYTTGYFVNTIDFDPGVGVANLTSTGSGNYDVFVSKLSQCTNDNTDPIADVLTLSEITNQCSVTSLIAPTATDNCAGVINGTHNATLPITTQGTTIITWTYDDGNGNTITQNQNVIIDDNTNPVADVATLPDLTTQCSVTSLTSPTATDNCAGTLTATHNAFLPITMQGTTVVTWTYNDGNGNTITQNQNVIIDDTTSPVPNASSLADVTDECSLIGLTTPSATDNCSGIINATHNVTFPITTLGTTVVTWTYEDWYGNSITQNQNVIVTAIDNSVSVNTITLTANASGYSYQWIDCANGNSPISGETNQSFTATTNGIYAVEISNGSCTVTTSCEAITQVGLDENSSGQVTIYPNPFVDHVTVKSSETIQEVQVTNNTGQVVQTSFVLSEDGRVELNDLAAGIYFVRVKTESAQFVYLLIKE